MKALSRYVGDETRRDYHFLYLLYRKKEEHYTFKKIIKINFAHHLMRNPGTMSVCSWSLLDQGSLSAATLSGCEKKSSRVLQSVFSPFLAVFEVAYNINSKEALISLCSGFLPRIIAQQSVQQFSVKKRRESKIGNLNLRYSLTVN